MQVAKRSDMINAVHKGLRFADTQESCFETWKRSHMGSSALIFGRFDDSQESCFQASKRSWNIVVLLIFKICFQAAKRSDMESVELQGGSVC